MLRINLKTCLVSLTALSMVGCATMRPLDRVEDQTQFVQSVVLNNPQILSFKAKTKIEVKTKDKTYNFKANIMMSNAAQMFMETYGFGVPQGYAALASDRLKVVLPGEKEAYVGTGSSSLSKILKINVTMNELFDPILKKIVISEDSPPTIEQKSDEYIIRDAEKTVFHVNEDKWITKIERRMGFLVEYGYPVSQKMKFPKDIRLSFEHQSIRISFEDVKVNEPIPYEAFQINVPTDTFHVYPIE